jgi:hypothetical protein
MDGTWQKIASFSNLEEGPRSSFASRIKLIQCLEFLTGCYRLVIGITSSKEPLNLMHTLIPVWFSNITSLTLTTIALDKSNKPQGSGRNEFRQTHLMSKHSEDATILPHSGLLFLVHPGMRLSD